MIRSSVFVLILVMLSLGSISCASLVQPLPVMDVEAALEDATDDSTGVSAVSDSSHRSSDYNMTPRYAARSGPKVHGYYAWWTRGLWLDLDLSLYDKLFFFDLTPAADGSIQDRNGYPFAWQGLIQAADSVGVPVIPTLALLDADSLEALFLNPEHRERLVRTSLGLIEESDGNGLHLDFEWFAPAEDSLREGFHAYVDTLALRVEETFPMAQMSMFVPAFHPDGMIDLSRIPDVFDEIMVQGYDLHWQTGPMAGPVSPLSGWQGNNWDSIMHQMDEQGVERSRLLITVPYYGYEWPVVDSAPGSNTRGNASVTTHARIDSFNLPEMQVAALDRVAAHGLQRDPVSGSPFYTFQDSTGWVQGWYEDEESFRRKYEFVLNQELAGIAVFPIGYDRAAMDGLLEDWFGNRQQQ